MSAKVGIPSRTVTLRAGQGSWGRGLVPGGRQRADPGEEHRRLDLHVQPQGQVPVIPFHVARASGVFEIQDCFQGLQDEKVALVLRTLGQAEDNPVVTLLALGSAHLGTPAPRA